MRTLIVAVLAIFVLGGCQSEPEVSGFERMQQRYEKFSQMAPAKDERKWDAYAVDAHADLVCQMLDQGESFNLARWRAVNTGYTIQGAEALLITAVNEKCPRHQR
jgi:hypothetical protein